MRLGEKSSGQSELGRKQRETNVGRESIPGKGSGKYREGISIRGDILNGYFGGSGKGK